MLLKVVMNVSPYLSSQERLYRVPGAVLFSVEYKVIRANSTCAYEGYDSRNIRTWVMAQLALYETEIDAHAAGVLTACDGCEGADAS